ncbi:DUF2127 domain-containing protein [Kamptonema formosum]|uniref:DUF2127 domain-containing protein n=1 Tax=Kamptonema formosum TaxID=331992 RepID=UPI00034A0175|nr:DUF2127 domain-containing protein [Oscillatoria sp. PCC 10802]
MGKVKKRSAGLMAIVFYKAFSASLLACTSAAILLAVKHYEGLQDFAEEYALEGKLQIIKFLLENLSNLKPRTLEFSGIAAGIYSAISLVEALGLWYQKAWATFLVLGLVGISLPAEIFELFRSVTPVKLVVFVVNLAVFWYLLRERLKDKKSESAGG